VKQSCSLSLGLIAWWLAIGASLAAQSALTPFNLVQVGVIAYGVAVILAVVGTSLIDRCVPLPDPATDAADKLPVTKPDARGGRRGLGVFLAIVAAVALAGAEVSEAATKTSTIALPLWLASLTLLTVGIYVWMAGPFRFHLSRAVAFELIFLAVLLALALALRLLFLTRFPGDVDGDEGAVGVQAQHLLNGDIANVFGFGWFNQPYLGFVPSFLGMRFFGNGLFGLRVASVAQGWLSIALLYGLAKRCSPRGSRPLPPACSPWLKWRFTTAAAE